MTDDFNLCVDNTIHTRAVTPASDPITSDLKELLNKKKKRAFREGDGELLRSVHKQLIGDKIGDNKEVHRRMLENKLQQNKV